MVTERQPESTGKRVAPRRSCKPASTPNKIRRAESTKRQTESFMGAQLPWTPVSAMRRCLAAAERNSLNNTSVRPALRELIDKIKPSLRETIHRGTNNSFALVGPHGCGKSLVITTALQQVQQELKDQGSEREAITVHLSGALHSDKGRAFKFMARKLCEHCGSNAQFVSSASVEENELFLRQVLAEMDTEKRSVVFVLNDMSRFVGGGRSTTLYTLLDLLHTNTGVAVIGISTVNVVLDLMEKRAKSRFSNHVFIVPSLSATKGDENHPCAVLKQMLTLKREGLGLAEDASEEVEQIEGWNATLSSALADPKTQEKLDKLGYWPVSCADLLTIASRACSQFHTRSILRGDHTSCASPELQLATSLQESVDNVLESAYPVSRVLSDSSDLQKQLVAAAERLRDGPYTITFETLLREYRKGNGLRMPEPVVWAAFQSLQLSRVLRPAQRRKGAAGTLSRQPVGLNFRTADASACSEWS